MMSKAVALLVAAIAVASAAPVNNVRHRRGVYSSYVGPVSIGANELAIYLGWDVDENDGTYDMDQMLVTPDGCIIHSNSHVVNQPLECDFAAGGAAWIGGLESGIQGGGTTYLDYPDNGDATSWSGDPVGWEMIWLMSPLDLGDYKHLVYSYNSATTTGYVWFDGGYNDALVKICKKAATGAGADCTRLIVVTQAANQSTCYGRFWHTFKITVTDNEPLAYTVTDRHEVSATPYATMGSTATLDIENGHVRTTAGCGVL